MIYNRKISFCKVKTLIGKYLPFFLTLFFYLGNKILEKESLTQNEFFYTFQVHWIEYEIHIVLCHLKIKLHVVSQNLWLGSYCLYSIGRLDVLIRL